MTTVRSLGSPKYSLGLAALRASAMKSLLRQARIPGELLRTIVMRDRKYDALSASI